MYNTYECVCANMKKKCQIMWYEELTQYSGLKYDPENCNIDLFAEMLLTT